MPGPSSITRRSPSRRCHRSTPAGEVASLLRRTVDNHRWRQEECINLIPSEMTPSPLVRLVSVTDPAFRYAEHRELEAFDEADIFYYQGTGFIDEVEQALEAEMRRFLGAAEVETRLISGQMANAALFSALVDYLNRWNRKGEPRRLRMVMNNHIGKGGHLSAQPMGALKDFVAIDPRTDRPAVVNFPVLPGDQYRIDVAGTLDLIDRHRPELIIFGKSMVLHKEPVADDPPVRGRAGAGHGDHVRHGPRPRPRRPHFQQPFAEGADFVTGSTHKTFFGTQRGVIGTRFRERDEELRAVGDRPAPHLPRLRLQPPPGDHAGPARRHLRDEPLQGRLPAGGDRRTPRPSPGRSRPRGCTWPVTPPSATPRPTR